MRPFVAFLWVLGKGFDGKNGILSSFHLYGDASLSAGPDDAKGPSIVGGKAAAIIALLGAGTCASKGQEFSALDMNGKGSVSV